MTGRLGPRFGRGAFFIVLAAIAAGFLQFDPLGVVLVAALAWAIVAAVEIASARRRRPRDADDHDAAVTEAPAAQSEKVASQTELAEVLPLRPAPAPLSLVQPVAPPPESDGAAPDVARFTPRDEGPREWNLRDLETRAQERAGEDPIRDEERSHLLMYLREFANADGVLPADFDGLVRESFGDLITAGRR